MQPRAFHTAIAALAVFALLPLSTLASASDDDLDAPSMAMTVSQANVLDEFTDTLRYGVEYRFGTVTAARLSPVVGITTAANGASFIYADVRRGYAISRHWSFTASFGLGRYDPDDVIDLGHLLEFRSGAVLAFHLVDQYSLELALFHFSNGGIGRTNPGTEALMLSFAMPLGESGN